jgi:hypothetical protein
MLPSGLPPTDSRQWRVLRASHRRAPLGRATPLMESRRPGRPAMRPLSPRCDVLGWRRLSPSMSTRHRRCGCCGLKHSRRQRDVKMVHSQNLSSVVRVVRFRRCRCSANRFSKQEPASRRRAHRVCHADPSTAQRASRRPGRLVALVSNRSQTTGLSSPLTWRHLADDFSRRFSRGDCTVEFSRSMRPAGPT